MSSSASNFMEDADHQALIQVRTCTNGSNRNVANLVIVNAGDVHLASASWIANEDTIRAPDEAVSSPVNEGVFGRPKIALADTMLECLGNRSVNIIVTWQPGVKLSVDMPHRFAHVIAKSLLMIAKKDGGVGITKLAAQRF